MSRKLSEKQSRFLDSLFLKGVDGDFEKAKLIAGYAEATPTSQIVEVLEEEVLALTRRYVSSLAPKAAYSLHDLLNSPTQLGAKDRLAITKDVLDRTGLGKTEKLEVTGNALFILPPKNREEDDS